MSSHCIRRLYKAGELDQVLLAIGLARWRCDLHLFLRADPEIGAAAGLLPKADASLGFRSFPTYRAFLIVVGVVLIAALWYTFEKTNIGAKIRAAVDNRRMAVESGINVDLLFTATFAVGKRPCGIGRRSRDPVVRSQSELRGGLSGAVPDRGRGRRPRRMKGTLVAALVLGVFDTAGKYLLGCAASSSMRSHC